MHDPLPRDLHNFYSAHSYFSDPDQHHNLLDGLPADLQELCKIAQGLLLHLHWVEEYGVHPPEERKQEANLRFISKQLTQIVNLDESALNITRSWDLQLLGTCRDYSVMLCAFLRHQGIPARARCGFANYFTPGKFEDHWVCEYWQADEQRWVLVDAQLDQLQRQALKIDFDPLDIPPGKFFVGGKAWQMCRMEQADPLKFGVFDMHGLWFVRGNVVRDFASLNKMELLPWDCWGLIEGDDEHLSDEDWALLDRAAALTLQDDISLADLGSSYKTEKGLSVPPVINSFTGGRFQQVDISEDCESLFLQN